MASYIKRTPRMDIFIDSSSHSILVQQKWEYSWLTEIPLSPWTYEEKRDFHKILDDLIWSQWSGHYQLMVGGPSRFSAQHKNTTFVLNFDIKWELTNGHWEVRVTRTTNPRTISSVEWGAQRINLDSYDAREKTLGTITGQTGVTHEFGHAIGNSKYAYSGGHGDEYKSSSPNYADKASIMNLGAELRERHIDYILRELNTMIPGTIFQFKSIKP